MSCAEISLFFMFQDVRTALKYLNSLASNSQRHLSSQIPVLKPTNQDSPISLPLSGFVYMSVICVCVCVYNVHVPGLLFHRCIRPFLTQLTQSQQILQRNCQHFLHFLLDQLVNSLFLAGQTKAGLGQVETS